MAEYKLSTISDNDNAIFWKDAKNKDNLSAVNDSSVLKYKLSYMWKKLTINHQYGSTVNVQIPENDKLARNFCLKFVVAVDVGEPATNTTTAMAPYIAHNLLKRFSVQLGATEQYIRKSENIIMSQLLELNTESQKEKLLALSGRQGLLMAGTYELYMPLSIMGQSLNISHKNKPFPLYLMKESLNMVLEFNSRENVFALAGTATAPRITKCELLYEAGKAHTVENYIRAEGEQAEPINYPFLQCFDQSLTLPNGVAQNITTSVNLTGVHRGEIDCLILQVRPSTAYHCGRYLYDLSLELSGTEIWRCSDDSQLISDFLYDSVDHSHVDPLLSFVSPATTIYDSDSNIVVATNNLVKIKGASIGLPVATGAGSNYKLVKSKQFFYYVIPFSEIINKDIHAKMVGVDAEKLTFLLKFKCDSAINAGDIMDYSFRYQTTYVFEPNSNILQAF